MAACPPAMVGLAANAQQRALQPPEVTARRKRRQWHSQAAHVAAQRHVLCAATVSPPPPKLPSSRARKWQDAWTMPTEREAEPAAAVDSDAFQPQLPSNTPLEVRNIPNIVLYPPGEGPASTTTQEPAQAGFTRQHTVRNPDRTQGRAQQLQLGNSAASSTAEHADWVPEPIYPVPQPPTKRTGPSRHRTQQQRSNHQHQHQGHAKQHDRHPHGHGRPNSPPRHGIAAQSSGQQLPAQPSGRDVRQHPHGQPRSPRNRSGGGAYWQAGIPLQPPSAHEPDPQPDSQSATQFTQLTPADGQLGQRHVRLSFMDALKLSGRYTQHLGSATDWQSLQVLLNEPQLVPINHIHTAAAWRRLASLQQGPSQKARAGASSLLDMASQAPSAYSELDRAVQHPQYASLLQQLEQIAVQTSASMMPREASTVLWAAATLQHTLDHATVVSLLQVLSHHQSQCSEQDLCTTVWAVGRMLRRSGVVPQQELGDMQSLRPHQQASIDDRASGNKSVRQSQPQQEQQRRDMSTSQGPTGQQGCQGVAGSQQPSGANARRVRGPRQSHNKGNNSAAAVTAAASQLAAVVLTKLPSMSDRALVVSLHGLSMLPGCVPRAATAQDVMRLMDQRMAGLKPRDMATVLSSMVQLGCVPPEPWLRAVMVQVSRSLPQLQCEEAVLFLYACSVWQFRPAPQLLLDVCRHTSRRFSTCSMRHLCLLLWGLGKLRWCPPSDWLDALTTEVMERAGELQAHELTLLMHGMAALRFVPEVHVMRVLLARVESVLAPGITPMQLATLCWALPLLTPDVGNRVRVRMAGLALSEAHQLSGEGFAKVLWGIARCAVVPPSQWWLEDMFKELVRRRHTLGPQSLPMALWGLAKLGHHRKAQVFRYRSMAKIWTAAQRVMPGMNLKGLNTMLHASKWVDYAPPLPILQEVTDYISMLWPSMQPSTLQGISSTLWCMRRRQERLLHNWAQTSILRRRARKHGQRVRLHKIRRGWYRPFPTLTRSDGCWRPVGWARKMRVGSGAGWSLTVRGERKERGAGVESRAVVRAHPAGQATVFRRGRGWSADIALGDSTETSQSRGASE